ncbi:MAG: hypothetical protein IKS48_11195 [Eubacterium sp.]|nr:hypothetical protein [Eubacterium sp.]
MIMISCLSSCGSEKSDSKLNSGNNVQNVIEEQIAKEEGKTEKTTTETATYVETPTTEPTTEQPTTQSANLNNDKSGVSVQNSTVTDAYVSDTESVPGADPNVDVDLTVMNSDMVYATVYQMMVDPDSYVGKKIKMEGAYYSTLFEDTGKRYHFVLIKDAMACCQQGLEFIWDDDSHVYPDEYPSDNTEVQVTGTFETYKDNPDDDVLYCHLVDSSLEVE